MNRWTILAVLFLARMAMAFQFQSVGAVSPVMARELGLDLAAIGLLIGLYFAPGAVVALPGGAVAARFGEKRVVTIAMAAMLAGSVLIALSETWAVILAGRGIAGAGGVVLNIVMTKMLVDWFEGREVSTAMAIFVNSWPVGIALALLVLPAAAVWGGLGAAWWSTAALVAGGLALFAALYRAPPGKAADPNAPLPTARALPWGALGLAALIWAGYNTALALILSFGPTILADRGWSIAAAGSAISAFTLIFALFVPVGGIVADRTGRRDAVIAVSLLAFAVLMPLLPALSGSGLVALLLLVGAAFGLAAGPIMVLPSLVLSPPARTFGMGVFFTVYYLMMMIAPRIVGGLADRAGNAAVAVHVGAGLCGACVLALALFRWLGRQRAASLAR